MKRLPSLLPVYLVLSCLLSLLSAQPSSRPKIVVTGITADQVNELRQSIAEAEIVAATREELLSRVADADGLIGSCSADAIRAGKKLRWVQTLSAGVEGCRSPELVNSPIVLTNAKIIMGPEIADHALALLLSLTRGLNTAMLSKPKAEWRRQGYQPIELRGKTALIIGVGGIGTQIAERASAFGMRVLGVDPKDIPLLNSVEKTYPPDQLREVLPEADVVFMAAPHTTESQGMMGTREFALMKRGAYFVNVSRGKTVDTPALVQALASHQLAGAGLDVTDPEPLPSDHPLWKLDNVVITPHIAGQSDQLDTRRMELFKNNIRRLAKGLPLLNAVDKQKGY